MPKFNQPAVAPQPTILTHEGGSGYEHDPRQELFLLGVASAVGEDSFYEQATERDSRLVALVHAVADADPAWLAEYARWLRGDGLMRSASIVVAAEYVRARHLSGKAKPGPADDGPRARDVVASVLQRPDEPAEMLGYWTSRYGKPIPRPILRGIADALPRLYNERNTLKYDGQGKPWRFGDVVDLAHPLPDTKERSALYSHLIDRRHGHDQFPDALLGTVADDRLLMALAPEVRRAHLADAIEAGWSWERLAGWLPGGMDAEAWEAVAPNMGLMALARNLRNFDEAGMSDAVASTIAARFADPEEVRRSRQFPLRFLTAWKAVTSMRWGAPLEAAMNLSLANVPALDGRTLVLIDVSGSMNMNTLASVKGRAGRGEDLSPRLWEAATIFGVAVARRSAASDVYLFANDLRKMGDPGPSTSILRAVDTVRPHIGGGTYTANALAAAYERGVHDRVVIVTDEQAATSLAHLVDQIRVPVTTWNLAGHRAGHSPSFGSWTTIGGLSDASFTLLPILERRAAGRWPWEVDR